MGLFDKINDAKPNNFGKYITPGLYKFRIEACKMVNPRSGGESFTVELTVLETDNPAFRVGESASWQAHSKHDSAASNIRHFIADATGVKFEDVDEAGARMVVSAENPLAGTEIYALATNIKTRAGKDFTRVSWSLEPFAAEAVARERNNAAAQPAAAPATPAT